MKCRLVGADATQAWLAVYCPGFGYIDLDPTNGEDHMTVCERSPSCKNQATKFFLVKGRIGILSVCDECDHILGSAKAQLSGGQDKPLSQLQNGEIVLLTEEEALAYEVLKA